MMDKNIEQLVDISRKYGQDKSFVIAGGGNTSYKDDSHIWVKASGVALETIDENGFVCLSRQKLKVVSEKSYSANSSEREAEVKADLAAAIVSTNGNRPSVETSMHEIIDYSFVVHTHPTKVNALMCSNSAEESCRELFGEKALFIKYTDPGYVLFKKVEEEIILYTKQHGTAPQIIFLENHGVFVAANSVMEIDALYAEIMGKISSRITTDLPANELVAFDSVLIDKVTSLHPEWTESVASGLTSDLIQHFVKNEAMFQKASSAFTPDDIVYCKAYYLFVPAKPSQEEQIALATKLIADYKVLYGYLPKVLALEGQGVIAVEDTMKSVQNVLEVFVNILKISCLSENFGGPQFMTKSQIEFIDNWEVENYRRQMAKSKT